ncbi:hypothetical protein R69608_07686 [Paraburkholderia nemoris]|uniref:Uncharacterized protein n=1 Tax=Paraburkholderia nemoris TaxID=2793076 RepID=A0ABM8T4U8_9BURK|nr:hypothetical protein R69619_07133 [Paraburkholderia nemoris]CAE6857560.1 hypothetical protein R75777_07867 [Paraburkholderia nemoris]CAE6858181.1 hypothetical protein R69776_07859 [Paraburkholderia nemoris]CAE6890731.1 hypothetical protein R69749_07594 [Paraburkholderia domus]CAE6971799.1 hypothetical protein R69608_07686 [Paraburkholderia nemoris]
MNANNDLDPLETDDCLHALAKVQAHSWAWRPPHLAHRPADPSKREGAYAPRSLTTPTRASTISRMHRPTRAATARSRSKRTTHLALPLTRESPAGLASSRLEDTAMPF